MLFKLLIFVLIYLNLHANTEIEDTYYVDNRIINSSVITKDTKNDFTILSIDKNSNTQKIKTKDLMKLLSDHGYKNYHSKKSYINFILKSPIDVSLLKLKLKEYYEKNYETIDIQNISIEPRGHITALPKDYIVNIESHDFLSKNGIINIKTAENKKIFFNYLIKATVMVYISSDIIKKEAQISPQNYIKKSVVLDKFRAKPIQNIDNSSIQAKRHIPKDTILTHNDIELLHVIKRDSMINVTMSKDGMNIIFSAKALQDAKVDDIIKVQNSNGKILKAKVTGSNKAELE
ncbi:MAG: flagellar basal body P-ring formation chaperone FlgA [Sulfurimonas sp.]|uniref:flagellar basal body P-ring formation chaperone FlgA n=1 Tax=Sulfurimonas sp. TaxID=2022749 RepID=UPI00262FC8C3|nr:flagellar basal body P-ring formation chaperone FlgA [Sulfurimonas sp.]MDD5372180.1 flagellar basal body P-ring formation chaperone FlgA [Sulfurimonas sp.]